MHDTYTILHLTPWTRAGLICLSAVLAALMLYAAHRAHHKAMRVPATPLRWLLHAAIALTALWLFIWLSPQIYYVFYLATIPNLPAQIVIGNPPSFAETASLFSIDFTADLPPISQGLLGWLLLAQAAWHMRPDQMQRPDDA